MVILKALLKITTLLISLLANYFVSLEASMLYPNTSHVNVVRCIKKERLALLKFKDGVVDPSGFLSSWVGSDCCTWKGVGCRYPTGEVVKLHLGNPKCFSEYVEYYDYRYYIRKRPNNSSFCLGGKLSNYIGELQHLSYLNLSYNYFSGMIPPQLGNLSNLRVLDLNSVGDSINSYVSDLNWLSGLSSLKFLDLSNINLSLATTHWLQAINTIPSLVELHMLGSHLHTSPLFLSHSNLTSLSVLDLSYNNFSTVAPQWLFNLTTNLVVLKLLSCDFTCHISNLLGGNLFRYNYNYYKLEELDLSYNYFSGELPDSLEHLKSLRTLDLSANSISGPLPTSIGKLSKLGLLRLSYNKMSGSIPKSLGRLGELKSLDLSWNEWEGILSQDHFQGLKKLKKLSIYSINGGLIRNLSYNWLPPFSLTFIHIEDCDLGPKFPKWLQTQIQLESITLRNVSISDTIPSWFWKSYPHIYSLDLSYNQLRGSIPVNIGQLMSSLEFLDLSWNSLNGSIPSSLGKMSNLTFLFLSNNQLSGKIHDQWMTKLLGLIDFSNNNLSGKFPASLFSSPYLRELKLSNNRLSGELPFLSKSGKNLTFLDLGDNKLSGSIPKWIGEGCMWLNVLRMRGNLFNGSISEQFCRLQSLHVLDLAQNNLSGAIPTCLSHLDGMNSNYINYSMVRSMELNLKGIKYMYAGSILYIVKAIDLSCNNLSGLVPEDITNLIGLGTLNLSNNHLTGKIPSRIGEMRNLETLDLSSNHFYGQIPPSISSMTTLSHLNLSHNNLSGPIPSSTQLSTFDESIYEGNLGLCGSPLPTKCGPLVVQEEGRNNIDEDKDEKEDGKLGLFVSVALGFIFGFWSICGSLVIRKSWRDAYFGFINKSVDWIVVIVAVNLNRLQKKIAGSEGD